MSDARQTVDRLITAPWVIPIVPENITLTNHAVVMDNGRIEAVLPIAEAEARFEARERLDLDSHVLMPGLINTHGHAAMTLLRGIGSDQPLMEWLTHSIWPAEGAFVSESFIADGTELAMAEMLRSGTTTFSDMYFFPEITAEMAHRHGMRAQVCIPILDFPTPWGNGPDDYLRKGLDLLEHWRHSERLQVAFGPHAPYTVSDGPLKEIATLAHQVDAPVQIHLHETAQEITDAINNNGLRPSKRLADLGLMTPTTQCVHMTQVDDYDLKLLQDTGAHVLHCPEANMKLGSGQCPVHRLLEADVNVALGTDGAASNNDLDLFGEMRSAALLGKVTALDGAALPVHQVLRLATINGARALGQEDRIGSLEAGKEADLIAVDLGDTLSQPVYDPAAHLIYSTSSRQVSHSWIAGEPQLVDGELKRIDLHDLKQRVGTWQHKIATQTQES